MANSLNTNSHGVKTYVLMRFLATSLFDAGVTSMSLKYDGPFLFKLTESLEGSTTTNVSSTVLNMTLSNSRATRWWPLHWQACTLTPVQTINIVRHLTRRCNVKNQMKMLTPKCGLGSTDRYIVIQDDIFGFREGFN